MTFYSISLRRLTNLPKCVGSNYPFGDKSLLAINSPKELVERPYVVVYKSEKERWAIVAMTYDGKQTLGIRWFWDNSGFPNSRGYGTWTVLAKELTNALLSGLTIKHEFKDAVNYFLVGKINGKKL